MNVLHFFKTYYPDSFGGVERTIHALSKGMNNQNIRSTVLSLSRFPHENSITFDGHRADKARLTFEIASTGFSLSAFRMFVKASQKADVIHYHFPWPFMDIVNFLHHPRKPSLVTYHSDIVKQQILMRAYKPLMHHFLGRVDRIVATSENYASTSEVLKYFKDKVCVIPIGLEENDYLKAPIYLKQKWTERFKRPYFLFVGVLRYYKGLQFLLQAASGLPADVVIVGEGPMGNELKRLASDLRLDNVFFVGNQSDLDKAALLEMSTALVFPSHLRSEAYGLTLVEAAMFGKPMISCELGTGTSFVNLHQKTGLVVPPMDPKALALAMNKILHDETLRETFGKEARIWYLNELRAETMISRYVGLYRHLCR